eukprot:197143-Rhodomonas_salina.1
MAEKARLFGDEGTRKQILSARGDPKKMKALGRKVQSFDEKTWDEKSLEVVITGNIAKFEQNPRMCQQLLATGRIAPIVLRSVHSSVLLTSSVRAAVSGTNIVCMRLPGSKTLVEASPRDPIWGIGLRADDPACCDPSKWKGIIRPWHPPFRAARTWPFLRCLGLRPKARVHQAPTSWGTRSWRSESTCERARAKEEEEEEE